MDSKLTYKLSQMTQMLKTLEDATMRYQKKQTHDLEAEITIHQDSVIQRLEYCVDHFWKLLKIYMETTESLTINENGPRSIARIAALNNLISEEEAYRLIQMVEERNKTSHMYHAEVADEIARFAPKGLAFMHLILKRLEDKYAAQKSSN